MLTLYISAAVFGGGVMITDLFGLLNFGGGHGGDSGDDGGAEGGGEEDSDGSSDEHAGAALMHGRTDSKQLIVRIIGGVKSAVYFSFGFGAVGWFALADGYTGWQSLLWSVPVGAVVMVGARMIKRLQRNELDSQFNNSELLMTEAEVLVSILPGQIGKIRIKHEGAYLDRFAKGLDAGDKYQKGAVVRVMDIDDEYYYVGI